MSHLIALAVVLVIYGLFALACKADDIRAYRRAKHSPLVWKGDHWEKRPEK